MPRGQHRPGVKVIRSPHPNRRQPQQQQQQQQQNEEKKGKKTPEYLAKQLKSAKGLEEQLKALSENETKQQAGATLRAHLCEVLSDLILIFPAEALKENCFHRLWNMCFYKPIVMWRKRVEREKRKNLPTLKQSEQAFKHFLEEAMAMYDYLIGAYMTALTPNKTPTSTPSSQSQDSTASSQDSLLLDSQLPSQDDSVAMIDENSVAPLTATEPGVVAGLYKLFIYMGDLQRYAEKYSKAESNYLSASKLGPGFGNPYNQLAVVSFSRESFCNSLYWYARSLVTTHEKFPTSFANLKRLFAANREKLEEYGRNAKPTVLSALSQSSLLSNSKKLSKEETAMALAQKSAAIKSCFAHFVDLHYDFFLMQEDVVPPQQNHMDSVREKMTAVLASLESIMQVQSYSDSMLCKLVVVSAFSLERSKSSTPPPSQTEVVPVSRQLPAEFLYMLGSTLAKKLEVDLSKVLYKANPGKAVASVKLLVSLEILAEFVDVLLLKQPIVAANANDTHLEDAERDFWTRAAKIGSMVQQVVDKYKLPTNSLPAPAFQLIKEYKTLKGFRPLQCVNEQYAHSVDGFIDPLEAMDVLDLTQNTQSQVSAGASTVSGGGSEENKAKLVRWLELCNKFASAESNAPLSAGNEDAIAFVYKMQGADQGATNGPEQEPQDDGAVAMQSDDDDDDAGDVVVYQLPQDGVGPPLLVPGNMSGSTKSPPPLQQSYQSSLFTAYREDNQKENSDSLLFQPAQADVEMRNSEAPAPCVMPPPGFGPPPGLSTQAGQMSAGSAFPLSNNLLGQVIQGRAATEPSQAYAGSANSMFPGFGNNEHGDFLFGSNKPLQGQFLTVAESPHLFGDIHTANPFATPIGVPIVNFDDSINTLTHGNNQETSLLDSGLLNSLFGEDVKTNNPWANH